LSARGAPRLLRAKLLLIPCLVAACHSSPEVSPSASAAPGPLDQGHLLYQASATGIGKRRKFRLALALWQPERFRLEVHGAVGGPRLVIASDGTTLRGALPASKLFAEGPAGAKSLQALVGLPLSTGDLLGLLTGTVVLGFGGDVQETLLVGGDRAVLQLLRSASGGVAGATLRVEDGRGGAVREYRFDYGDRRDAPWGDLPHEIRIAEGKRVLTLRLQSAVRRLPPPDAFDLVKPSGFHQVGLGELGDAGAGRLFREEGEAP
jgi:hypothetical protein